MSTIKEKLPYDEFVDFLINELTPQKIISFAASPEAQERSRLLLERHSAGTLTQEEQQELQRILEFEHLFIYVKARALQSTRKT